MDPSEWFATEMTSNPDWEDRNIMPTLHDHDFVQDFDEDFESTTLKYHSCEAVKEAMTVVEGYALIFIAIFGIIGNVLSILVFAQKHMRKVSINILLLGLQVADLFDVIGLMLHDGIPQVFNNLGLPYADTSAKGIIDFIFLPVHFTAEVASHGFIVLITVERYIAICRPFKQRVWCSVKRATIASIITVAFAILFGLPLWLGEVLFENKNPVTNRFTYQWKHAGPLAGTEYEHFHFVYLNLIVVYVIPFTILIWLNIRIFFGFQESASKRKELTGVNPEEIKSSEKAMRNILFAIVGTFLICNIFQVISNVQQAFRVGRDYEWLKYFIFPYMKVFLCLNASTNFFFYCLFGKKFRGELKKLCKCG